MIGGKIYKFFLNVGIKICQINLLEEKFIKK